MMTYELTEEGDVWEIEIVGNLLDAFLRIFQLIANICLHRFVDQVKSRFTTAFPADGGKVFRGDAELIRIPSD